MTHTLYLTDGRGRWTRMDTPEQCRVQVLTDGRCQRERGHDGDHWCYSGDGSFCVLYAPPKGRKRKKWEAAAGRTPPGHERYRHPADMWGQRYLSKSTHSVVTDPELIARLERDETRSGESISRPVTVDSD